MRRSNILVVRNISLVRNSLVRNRLKGKSKVVYQGEIEI